LPVAAAADSVVLRCFSGKALSDGAGAVGLAAAAADEIGFSLGRGRPGGAAHDGAGNGVLAAAGASDSSVLVCCSGEARFDRAGAVSLAAAVAGEIIVSLGRGRPGGAVRDGAGNGVLAAANTADSVVLVWCTGETRSDGAGAVGLAATVAGEIIVLLGRGRSGGAARDGAGNGVLAAAGNGVLAAAGNGVLAAAGNGVLAAAGNGVLAAADAAESVILV